jgi:hypothetical protein
VKNKKTRIPHDSHMQETNVRLLVFIVILDTLDSLGYDRKANLTIMRVMCTKIHSDSNDDERLVQLIDNYKKIVTEVKGELQLLKEVDDRCRYADTEDLLVYIGTGETSMVSICTVEQLGYNVENIDEIGKTLLDPDRFCTRNEAGIL